MVMKKSAVNDSCVQMVYQSAVPILAGEQNRRRNAGIELRIHMLVEPAGIEPATSYLQIRLTLPQTVPDAPFSELDSY